MKRFIGLLLPLVLLLTLFTGCGKGKETSFGSENRNEPTTTAAPSSEEIPAVPRLCLVVAGAFGDGAIFDSAKEGCEKLEAEGLYTLNAVECGSREFMTRLEESAAGSELVVCVNRQPFEIKSLAEQYPGVRWICIDQFDPEPSENVLNLSFRQNEGAFLAGYIAAASSETGVVGAVGGMECDSVNDCILGFEQGARYFKEDTTVLYDYSGSDTDPEKAKDCAAGLNKEGADVIFQLAGAAGTGVFEAAEQGNFLAIGSVADQKALKPEVILCSMEKHVGDAVYTAVKNDVPMGQTWVVGLLDGMIGICYGDDSAAQMVPEEIKTEVAELAAMICDGTIVVDSVFR